MVPPQARLTLSTFFIVCLCAICVGFCPAWAQNDVLTQHNDGARTGLNPNETWLTPANVNSNQFGKLFTQPVDGIVAAQPLYANQILMNDGNVHNVVFVVTQHNSVYAFDADHNTAPLWTASLNGSGIPDPISDFGCTGTHYTEIGITSTPVIDPGKTTIYVVAKTLTGDVRNFSLHALDITTGNELLGGPVVITGTAQTGTKTFNPIYQMQRPALLLANGLVYVGFGGNGCDIYDYNGWLFAYDAQALTQQAAFVITPNGKKASIWQGGSGPAVDEFGNVYVVTANGSYDGPGGEQDYGDSVLKMGWNGSNFGIQDYFTPYNQLELAQDDLDLGSAGPLILPDQPGLYPHELVAGGKQGTLYLINRDAMGQYNPDFDNVIQSFPGLVPDELTGVPSYWNGSVYVAGDKDHIKQFPLVNGLLPTQPASQTSITFTGQGPASASITANGNSAGILWALGHSNRKLVAFDATNLANELYNSDQAAKLRDKLDPLTRFATPTISNGKVYIGGKTSLSVYGLLPSLSVVAGNNQTGTEKQVLPISLSVEATDTYDSTPIPGVTVTCKDNAAGGRFTPRSQVTDATGRATFTYQLPGSPQVVSISCSGPAYASAVFTETCLNGAPARMTVVGGNNQTGPPNTPLVNPFIVKVVDSKGYGIPGVTVNFTDNGAGGQFSANSAITAADGTASTQYTTGPQTGSVVVTASTNGVKSVKVFVTVQ